MYDKYIKHYSKESFFDTMLRYAKKIGKKAIKTALTLYYCMIDPDTPTTARVTIMGALGYLVLPLDLVPDVTPIVGFSDDIGALTLAWSIVAIHIKTIHINMACQTYEGWFGSGRQTSAI